MCIATSSDALATSSNALVTSSDALGQPEAFWLQPFSC